MRRKKITSIIALLVFVVSLLITAGLYLYNVGSIDLFKGNAKAESVFNNVMQSPVPAKVDILLDGVSLSINSPLYIIKHRLFIPVTEFVGNMGGWVLEDKDTIKVIYKGIESKINKSDRRCRKSGYEFAMKENIVQYNGVSYIDFFDIEKIMSFWSEWEYENDKICLFPGKNDVVQGRIKEGKIALVRLEDVGPGGMYRSSGSLVKLKVIADYLYSKGAAFHIAWIPRWVNPGENYDYDFLKSQDLYGAEFVYTLDYLADRGGIIGLHGYTHQCGSSQSGIGYEFYDTDTKKVNSYRKHMEDTIKKSIDTAQYLNIQYHFYESPHYWADKQFKRIMEKNFKYLYQSDMLKYSMGQRNIDRRSNGSIYVPTPLGYVRGGEDENPVTDELDKITPDMLASFFFHPFLEFKHIKLGQDGAYTYSENSKLHRTVDAFYKKGYRFAGINEIE